MKLRPISVATAGLVFGVASAWAHEDASDLKLIGVQVIPARVVVDHTVVGGLSGLAYDRPADRWWAISDDRAEFSDARVFVLRLDYGANEFTGARVEQVVRLRQPDGTLYPRRGTPGVVPDCEAIALDPADVSLWYTSEGDRGTGLDPWVRQAARDGRFRQELPLAPEFRFQRGEERGPRDNLTFEGLSFSPDGGALWVALEAPLYQDGPVPSVASGAFTRLVKLTREGAVLAEYAYPVEPLSAAPEPGRMANNGVADILALEDRLLVLERAGRQDTAGQWHFTARLFAADLSHATNIAGTTGLSGRTFHPANKRLLVDFARLDFPPVDNLEGLAWGRTLANGHRTLVLVSDDNFSATQSTQVWVFELVPAVSSTP